MTERYDESIEVEAPYVHGDLVGTNTTWERIPPEMRVTMQISGDPIADYAGQPDIMWGMAADELLDKATQAANAGSAHANDLFRRSKAARERSRETTVHFKVAYAGNLAISESKAA